MAKVYITTNDPITYYVYDEKESMDLFGTDMLDEYGTDIPDELLKEYKSAYRAFWEVQEHIKFYIKH